MNLFVLGAGYIGQALIHYWHNKEDHFFVSTTTQEKLSSLEKMAKKAFLLEGSNEELLREILTDCDAMVVSVAPGQKHNYEKTYLQTAHSIQNVLEKREKPLYLLVLSSTSVYGDHQAKLVDEHSSLQNSTEKGQVLRQTETIYLSCCNQAITVCILRLAGIYGPQRELEKRAHYFSGKTVGGIKESLTNHIHQEDILRAIEFCFEKRLEGIYNLANGDHPTREQLYKTLCDNLKIPPPFWDEIKSTEHFSNCLVSNQKIGQEGFSFLHRLKFEKNKSLTS